MSKKAKPQPKSGPLAQYRVDSNGHIEVIRPGSILMSVQTGKQTGLDTAEIAQLVEQANTAPKLAAVVREFIADIEAVGVKALEDENGSSYWPDLVPTYRHAKTAMKEAGL